MPQSISQQAVDDFPEWTEEDLAEADTSALEPPDHASPPEDVSPSTSNAVKISFSANATDATGGGFFDDGNEFTICDECEGRFCDSWLKKTFDFKVCDDCRDRDGKHGLVTKTDAKNDYLLKDEDFDVREPILKCITKKNPHNSNWGNMRLYLRLQVEQRALEVWGSEEALEEEREKREERKQKSKKRTFDKMITELRMNARSSLGHGLHGKHEHVFEEEEYDDERDVYVKRCKKCDHVSEYEKM